MKQRQLQRTAQTRLNGTWSKSDSIMEYFIETRFGDPVLAMALSKEQLVYGTALGQIGYFEVDSKTFLLLTETTEEGIQGIHIDQDCFIYASIGDLFMLCLLKTESGQWHMDGVHPIGREHTPELCSVTYSLQSETQMLIVTVGNEHVEPAYILSAETAESHVIEGLRLPTGAVPVQFTGDRLY